MSWAAQEFEGLELGDARRTQRLIKLVDDLSAQPTGSIPLACGGWPNQGRLPVAGQPGGGVARDPGRPYHADGGADGRPSRSVVHSGHDGTGFHHATGDCRAGAARYQAQHGLYMHPTLAVTPAGVALGVLDACMWARKTKNQPDVKESTRWVEGYEIVADLA